MPHFQVVLGGKWDDNAGSYGLAIGAVPSKNIPDVVDRLTERYRDATGRAANGSRRSAAASARRRSRQMLDELTQGPGVRGRTRATTRDWGDPREFTIGDMGTGECAGEVVSLVEFELADAEREVFEAQILLEEGDYAEGRRARLPRHAAGGARAR